MSKRDAPEPSDVESDSDWEQLEVLERQRKAPRLVSQPGPSSSGASSPDTAPVPSTPPPAATSGSARKRPAAAAAKKPPSKKAKSGKAAASSSFDWEKLRGKAKAAIVAYANEVVAEYVYELLYQEGEVNQDLVALGLIGKAFYVGRTDNPYRREGEYRRPSGKKARLVLKVIKLLNAKVKDMIRVVPELPHGVPVSRIREMEAFFIAYRGTMNDAADKRRSYMCNRNNGDSYDDEDDERVVLTNERYEEIKKEIENGFPHPSTWQGAPKLAKEEAVIEVIDEVLNQNEEEIDPAMRVDLEAQREEANRCRDLLLLSRAQHENVMYELYEELKTVATRYGQLGDYVSVERDELVKDLNSLTSHKGACPIFKKQINELVWVNDTTRKNTTINAMYAFHQLRVMQEWVGVRLEESLDLTTLTARRCLEMREWSAAHDGKAPVECAKRRKKETHESIESLAGEASLGNWINNWRGAYGKPEPLTVRVLLRHFPKLLDRFFGATREELSREIKMRLNAMLQEGYRWHDEEHDFEGSKAMYFRTSEYNVLRDLLNGDYDDDGVDTILRPGGLLTPERAEALRKRHDAKAPERRAQKAYNDKKRLEQRKQRNARLARGEGA